MAGERLALTARDRQILMEVGRFGVMTKDQLLRLGFFRSKTRAKERLKRLVDGEYLAVRQQPIAPGGPRFVYRLGSAASDSHTHSRRLAVVSDLFLAHELGLVDIRIALERDTTVKQWHVGKDLAAANLGIVPDAFCEYDVSGRTFCAFIEYDRGTETQARFQRKARAYADLAFSGRFKAILHRKYFRVFVVTDSVARFTNLSHSIAAVTSRIFWLTTLSELSQHGPLASIWRRPGADRLESLTDA
jgi:protein involved in plasmid replication-relaxation